MRVSSVLLMAAALVACNEGRYPMEAANIAPQHDQDSCEYYYYPWCAETYPDPSPSSPGLYFAKSYADCFTDTNDIDLDGMDEPCEYQLVEAFAPMLSTNPYDGDLSRETYWAVTPTGGSVRIIYMLGFHFDMGNNFATWCTSGLYCEGHVGDSEYIIVDVFYNSSTQHWETVDIVTSAHGSASGSAYDVASYPVKDRGYPMVFVARDKHGTYVSRSDCNSGGLGGSDDCTANADDARVDVVSNRNVGSSMHSLVSEPVYTVGNSSLFGGYEYFWQDVPFCGWDTASSASGHSCYAVHHGTTEGYYTILTGAGF